MQEPAGGLPVLNNPPLVSPGPPRVPVRTGGAAALRRHRARLASPGLEGVLRRALIGPAGVFLINTPVFLLPGRVNLQPKHRVLDLQAGRAAIMAGP